MSLENGFIVNQGQRVTTCLSRGRVRPRTSNCPLSIGREEAPPNSQDTAVSTLCEQLHVPVGPIGRGAERILDQPGRTL